MRSTFRNFAAELKKSMENRELRVALFDLDGVVFDTEPQYTVFWGAQCREFHPEHPGLEHEIKGQTLTQIYDRWFTGDLEAQRDLITQRLNVFEAQMQFPYVEGLAEFVESLHQNGVKTAVVTSSNRPKMESVYRQRPEFIKLFDAVLTSEDFAESKPSPDCYLKGAARFDVSPIECVVFEDSFNGLRSGRAAGMFVVGLTTTNEKDKIRSLSDCQIANYKEMNYKKMKQLWQAI
jgi:HAD superfamily hydrolase (TIGR01509 family)